MRSATLSRSAHAAGQSGRGCIHTASAVTDQAGKASLTGRRAGQLRSGQRLERDLTARLLLLLVSTTLAKLRLLAALLAGLPSRDLSLRRAHWSILLVV